MPTPANKSYHPGLAIIFALCSYIVLAGYIDLLSEFALYNEKRILQVVLLSLTCIISLVFFHRDIAAIFSRLPPLSKKILPTILLLGLISTAIHNTYYQQSLMEFGLFGLLFLMTLSVASIYQRYQHHFHKIILTCLLLTAGLQITSVTAGYIASIIEHVPLFPYELFLNFSNPRFLNQLQSWTLPLIVLPIIYWEHEKPYYKYIYILIAIGWWLLLFVSEGRGTLLGIGIAAILTLVIYKAHAKAWIKWQLICASSASLLYILLFFIVPRLINADTKSMFVFSALPDGGSAGRSYIWLNSWKLLQDNLLFGIGPMNFACMPVSLYPPLPAHPHNAIIQIAVEWGLPAALMIVFLFVWGCWCWIKKTKQSLTNNEDDKYPLIPIALFSSLVAAATHALFSGIIIMPHSQVMMILIIGWMFGIYFYPQKQPVHVPTVTSVSLVMLALICLFSLLVGMYPTMTIVSLDEMIVNQFPRFWQQGQFCG